MTKNARDTQPTLRILASRSSEVGARFSRRTVLKGAGAFGLLLGVPSLAAACGGSDPDGSSEAGGSDSGGNLSMLSYADFTSPENLEQFSVEVTPFNSITEGITKIEAGGSDYDLFILDATTAEQMISGGLLEKLPKDEIPNISNLTPQARVTPWDPSGDYTIVKDYTAVGWAYDRSVFPDGTGPTWDDFFAAVQGPASGKFVLYADGPPMGYSYMIANGIDPSTATEADVESAQQFWVDEMAPHIADLAVQPELNVSDGTATLVMIVPGALRNALIDMGDLEAWGYEPGVPNGMTYIDLWGIVAGSSKVSEAAEFLNFMLTPEAALREVETVGFPVPVEGVELPPDTELPELIYQPTEVVARAIPVLPGDLSDAYTALADAVQTAAS